MQIRDVAALSAYTGSASSTLDRGAAGVAGGGAPEAEPPPGRLAL
jgi:hypothetical protein